MAVCTQPRLHTWMVALAGIDGRRYVYRVYAPKDALPGDVFWSAFHHHDEQVLPRVSDAFDAAEIWQLAANAPERDG
ncbi:hypothetical protein [Streptomyces sparsus]